jgi:hypothetical protein
VNPHLVAWEGVGEDTFSPSVAHLHYAFGDYLHICILHSVISKEQKGTVSLVNEISIFQRKDRGKTFKGKFDGNIRGDDFRKTFFVKILLSTYATLPLTPKGKLAGAIRTSIVVHCRGRQDVKEVKTAAWASAPKLKQQAKRKYGSGDVRKDWV